MLFDKKYPNKSALEDNEDCIIYSDYPAEPCSQCGRLTHYVDYISEGHFCSEECLNAFYKDFFEALATWDESKVYNED